MDNPYVALTAEFNRGRLRALISSGQAVVLHRLAVASKDGDWILREDEDATGHVLSTLGAHDAVYRFGAPLDVRWLAGGWSSHFELRREGLRLRTDFVSRPPRVPATVLASMWDEAERTGSAVVGLEPLAAIKLTDREKDYPVVGELARRMTDPRARFRYSRSSRDLLAMAASDPRALEEARGDRELLRLIPCTHEVLDEALDRERRSLMRANEARLEAYRVAASAWYAAWPEVKREIEGLDLVAAHARVRARAEGVLPTGPTGATT